MAKQYSHLTAKMAAELAKEAARRYCRGVTGSDTPFWPVMPGFPASWNASAFQILSDLACNLP